MKSQASVVFVYVTAKNKAQALAIGRQVVTCRLASCANVMGPIDSFYWWKGKLNRDREAILVLKTRKTLLKRLTEEIKRLHTYECPCIVALPIIGGNASFLDWIRTETVIAQPPT